MNIVHQSPAKVYPQSINLNQDHISHELRISLTGMLGASYMLEQTGLTQQQQAILKMFDLSTKRLMALAESL